MSAVDDVDARLCRLEEALQVTQTQLLELSTQRVFNPTLGVDTDLGGRSVATLEITVIAGRNMLFQSGLLAGKGAYVRATLEPPGAARDAEPKCTQKRAIVGTPCWQETLVFQGISMVHSRLLIEVLQEEHFGADRVVGAVAIDVAALHDQRLSEQWHVLAAKDGQPTYGQLYLGCRLNRSQIFALEVESELLQNQIKELRDFVHRQRQFSLSLATPSVVVRTPSGRLLHGKEVPSAPMARTPPPRRLVLGGGDPLLAREPMHSPVIAVRKRERRLSSGPSTLLASTTNFSMMASTDMQQPRIKRRKLEPVTETHVESLSVRLANWLLPTPATGHTTATASTIDAVTVPPSPSQPQSVFTGPSTSTPPRRRLNARPTVHKKKAKSSALQTLENWLFQDASAPGVDRVHAQMQAER